MKSRLALLVLFLGWAPSAMAQYGPAQKFPSVPAPRGDYGPWQFEVDLPNHSVLIFNSSTGDLYTCPLGSGGAFKCIKAVRDPG